LVGLTSINRALFYFTIFYSILLCSSRSSSLSTPSVERMRDDLECSSIVYEYCVYGGGAILASLVSTRTSTW